MKHPARLAAALALLSSSASCTLIVDRSADQCESNDDCAAIPGTTCSAEKLCVAPTFCTTIEGDAQNENAFVIGSVLPTGDSTGVAIENGIRLAIREFQQTSNGLPAAPGGSTTRPLVLIGCDDNGDADEGVAAAQYLVSQGVQAVIGAAYSGITIKMVTEVTIPANVLAISPSATSVAITDLADNGLVWRTSPSDVYQAQAITEYLPQIVEPDVRLQLGLPASAKVKVTLLHKGDSYGSGLSSAIAETLMINGEPAIAPGNMDSFDRVDYGDPDDAAAHPTKYDQAVAAVLGVNPHVVILLGTDEIVPELMRPIEEGWTEPAYRPRYVISDGGVITALWEYVGTNNDLRMRITGTVPGTTNTLFNAFKSSYNAQFTDGTSPDIFGAAGAYDATYLLAYSAVSLGSNPVTGPNLAEGLKKLVPAGGATVVDVGTGAINGTFATLAGGGLINFNGASGPLNFDVATGEAPSDIQIWCMPAGGDGAAQSAIGSGLYLDAVTLMLTGGIGAICN